MSGVSKKDLQKVHFDDLQMVLGSMVQKHAKTLKLREQHGPAFPGKRAGSANFYFTNVVKTIINYPFGNGLYYIPPIYGDLGDGLPFGYLT